MDLRGVCWYPEWGHAPLCLGRHLHVQLVQGCHHHNSHDHHNGHHEYDQNDDHDDGHEDGHEDDHEDLVQVA